MHGEKVDVAASVRLELGGYEPSGLAVVLGHHSDLPLGRHQHLSGSEVGAGKRLGVEGRGRRVVAFGQGHDGG